jgi:hypothetical protein
MQNIPRSARRSIPFGDGFLRSFCRGVFLALALLFLTDLRAQAASLALGTSRLLVGPTAGSNSVVLAVTPGSSGWTATTNASWLHLSPANQSGAGSTNVVFSYDANSGATRSGTLTIAGLTLTVTQAGATYVPAGTVTLLPSPGAETPGEAGPFGTAVTGTGNVFTSQTDITLGNFVQIDEWVMSRNSEDGLMVIPDCNLGTVGPIGVGNLLAADSDGDLYIADVSSNLIVEWLATTGNLTNVVSSGLNQPCGVAVDGAGDIYIADFGDNAIKTWSEASTNVATLVSSGLNHPIGVAVDAAGNVYIADNGNKAIKEWVAANGNVTTLVSSGLDNPIGVAVDGAGNVYIADRGNTIHEWTAASGSATILLTSDVRGPSGLAVDGAGNLYAAGFGTNWIEEVPNAFVDPSARMESPTAGADSLPTVLPATQNLLPPFAPVSDESWLTITGITNGVVNFSFTATTSNRTGYISLLGQSIPVAQSVVGAPPVLSNVQALGKGVLQFSFTNYPGAVFTVLSTADLSLPLSNWTVAGTATNIASDLFRFTSQPTTGNAQLFYTVRSP